MRSRPIVHLVAAARPNFMKVAPLYHQLNKEGWCEPGVVHTGQHYDANMSDAFFRDLGIPEPLHHLGVGGGSHAAQTGGVMIAYEAVCMKSRPDSVVVVGDVNSTVACALVGAKLGIPVVHLEAGLRSRDRRMPEEINRLATDAISDLLWTPSPDADENLRAEGVPAERIEQVGNIMIDSYELMASAIAADGTRTTLTGNWTRYAVATLHRPSNVDEPDRLAALVNALIGFAARLPLVFPLHPRTRANLLKYGLYETLVACQNLRLTEPLGYVQFMSLVTRASAVVTDSGGIQEETTYLGIPCLTLRENTERPITISEGTNRLMTIEDLPSAVEDVLGGQWPRRGPPKTWDGKAAHRCAASLKRQLSIA